jgi:hypothetical protein
MAENVPPTSGSGTAGDDATRGLPYHDALKKSLRESIRRKQEMEEQLVSMQK